MSAHDNSKFRAGSAVYQCGLCGIKTRETGLGEASCFLCADCFMICGLDNEYNDNGTKPSAADSANIARHLANIARKGGNVQAVRDANAYAIAKAGAA